ncbi:MAG: hypothetical protein COU47_03770 [Candidatus Niyogibacteria bacterium CG10_big_fil_rev_8_21_14_0_10_46_36]|uniref:Uncharacterized protein n=1 Tax=Candidatus Niyogibacteria bacterium CG10_big_fil_rev_8_21_14_0_10_46_36 TaxID=1974726 RepID=A0A2H0TE05_9BACT|nr:MAG: hypothetical protein COU47_03770 [Candidatus Niyogibacteria bacterium CG10_big_fil_rev_8_21_14_0_10_46_36]
MEPLSALDFIKGFVWYVYSHHAVEDFPGPADWRWHELFCRVRKSEARTFPEVDFRIRFDWDGPHPHSGDISDALQALGMICDIDREGRYRTELFNIEAYKDTWDTIRNRACAERCYEIAGSMSGFFKE